MNIFILLSILVASVSASPPGSYGNCWPENARKLELPSVSSYLVCANGVWRRIFCPKYWEVNLANWECEPRAPAPIPPPSPQICVPASRIPFLFDNTKYQQCNWDGRSWRILYCQPNSVFNPQTSVCDNLTIPPVPTPPTPPPFPWACSNTGVSAFQPDPMSCRVYYECASGAWVQRKCPAGLVWNQQLLTCDEYRGQCQEAVHLPKRPEPFKKH